MGITRLDGIAMRVRLKLLGIKETKWHEYLVRFVVGGLITVTAGLIAEVYGPVIGGLFLAFPSIFPASITLVQSHAEKEGRGKDYELRERIAHQAAGVTAAGTTLGGAGLLCFAMIIWALAPPTTLDRARVGNARVDCRQRIRLAVPGVLLCQDAEEGEGNRLHLMRFGSSVLVFLAGIAGNSLNAGILTGILKM